MTAATSTDFVGVERLIHDLSHKWSRKFPSLPLEEFVSEAFLAYAKARKGFDQEKGYQFTTYLYRAVENSFRLLVSKKSCVETSDELDKREARTCFHEEVLMNLGEDARAMYLAIIQVPEELMRVTRSKNKSKIRKTVFRYFRNLGWAADRISESFREVEECLR